MKTNITFTQLWESEPWFFCRKARLKLRHGPGYRRIRTDFHFALRVTGSTNSETWQGVEPGTCLMTGMTISDGQTTIEIRRRPTWDIRFLTDRIETFRVYRPVDFNAYDFGELVVPKKLADPELTDVPALAV